MPKKRCKSKGKVGVKWGDHGKCYTGPDKERKMAAQRMAILMSMKRRGKTDE